MHPFTITLAEPASQPASAEPAEETGTALRWNERGFGFIRADGGGDDLFCHCTAIEDGNCLVEGAKVSFVKGQDERSGRDRAQNVTGGSTEEPGGPGGPWARRAGKVVERPRVRRRVARGVGQQALHGVVHGQRPGHLRPSQAVPGQVLGPAQLAVAPAGRLPEDRRPAAGGGGEGEGRAGEVEA